MRCYSTDIPDEIPEALSKSLRAPSYKTLAMAILKNDLNLVGAGFQQGESEITKTLAKLKKNIANKQGELF